MTAIAEAALMDGCGMENAPKGLARMILAEQVREALGHNEGD
jgi:hypothetical protein